MSCHPGLTGEIDPFSGSPDGRMNYPFIDFLWGTDPERPRFNPQSRSFSFTTQPGPMSLVLVSHRSKAGSADQLRWPEADLMKQPFLARLLINGLWRKGARSSRQRRPENLVALKNILA